MEKQFYNLKEIAELLGRHYMTIYDHVRKGLLPANKVGRNYIVSKEQLEQYLKGE